MLYFFFSSRRRHTRFDCDWSSDVCSSDLHFQLPDHHPVLAGHLDHMVGDLEMIKPKGCKLAQDLTFPWNLCRQDYVVSGNPVGEKEEKSTIPKVVDVLDLPPLERCLIKISSQLGAHFVPLFRYSCNFFEVAGSDMASIAAASKAAFVPLSTPTVPTGTPEGIWTIERIDSSPASFPETGTPMTGFVVSEATNPGRCAASPAIAMKTSDLESSTYRSTSLWFLWAEMTLVSYGMPSFSSTVSAFLAISRSLSDPINMLTVLVNF